MNHRSFLLTAHLIAMLGLSLLAATPSAAQTLEQALVAAYTGNPTLQAQRAALRATDEGVSQALSDWRPSLEASGSSGFSEIDNPAASDPRQQREPHTASLTLSQSLFSGGGTLAATRQAENSVMAGRADLLSVEQSVLLKAVSAYMNVFSAQSVLELNINNEQVLTRQLEATRDRYNVGDITRTDVHQAEARHALATANRIRAEGNLKASRATFMNVIGEAPGELARPENTYALPASFEDAVRLASENNPDVVKAEYTERAAGDNVDEIKSELLPSLDLSGSASRALNASGESTSLNSYIAKMTLTVPLYQSGSVYSRLRAARQTAAQNRRNIDQARRDAIESATRAWENLLTIQASKVSFEIQVNASEVALEGVGQEAAVGSRTVLDVLDAEQELLDAKVNLVGAERDEMIAIFELKSAIGELSVRHLNLPVTPYDSVEHYDQVRSIWVGGGPAIPE